jgi:hypothetical protein
MFSQKVVFSPFRAVKQYLTVASKPHFARIATTLQFQLLIAAGVSHHTADGVIVSAKNMFAHCIEKSSIAISSSRAQIAIPLTEQRETCDFWSDSSSR